MFVLTAKAKPAVLVSIGKVSLGINHPRGPHDHANAMTNVHTKTTTTVANVLFNDPVSLKLVVNIIPIASCKINPKKILHQKTNQDGSWRSPRQALRQYKFY